jgi:hypothetical protein
MDVKNAFETIVVGLLAIPWLLVLLHIVLYLTTRINLIAEARTYLNSNLQASTLLGTLFLAISYFIGSALFPLADDLFNDDRCSFGVCFIEGDDTTRTNTFVNVYKDKKYYDVNKDHLPNYSPQNLRAVDDKAALLLDKLERLKDLSASTSFFNHMGSHLHGSEGCNICGPLASNDLQCLEQQVAKCRSDLKNDVHAIYNYQKFAVYNLDTSYQILSPLKSQITLLRGAVLNGLCFFVSLCLLLSMLLVPLLLKKTRAWLKKLATGRVSVQAGDIGIGESVSRQEVRRKSLIVCSLMTTVVLLCVLGSSGVTSLEDEYDKQIFGIFHGQKDEKSQTAELALPPLAAPSPAPSQTQDGTRRKAPANNQTASGNSNRAGKSSNAK